MRILIVDDHRLFRDGLRPLLAREPGLDVVGEAGDGHQAVRLAGTLSPDVVLMDVTLPGLNGIDATRAIAAAHPRVRIVMLTMHADRRFVTESLKAGASGYLLKESAFSELLEGIRAVAAGGVFLSPRVAAMVVEDFVTLSRRAPDCASPLSSREREVLQQLAEGRSTKEIAHSLSVSVKTVETHRKQIMDKLGLHTVADLTKYAIREGLTSLG